MVLTFLLKSTSLDLPGRSAIVRIMNPNFQVHPSQANILKILLFKTQARFRDLNGENLPTDNFNFHLQALLKTGLLEKTAGNFYHLTPAGKEFANRFDTERKIIERQPKVAVAVSCLKGQGLQKEYLIQQRLKHPYFGFHGIVSGKVRWGETIMETAKRELLEETGLEIETVKLMALEHKMDYTTDGQLLEDKIFFILLGLGPTGNLKGSFEGGRNLWIKKKEILKLPNLFDDVAQILKVFEKDQLVFFENKFTVKSY